MADHWEFAWQHACGDFVIINSDDDVFSLQLLTGIDTASNHIVVGLASWDAGLYLYPDWDIIAGGLLKPIRTWSFPGVFLWGLESASPGDSASAYVDVSDA